MDIFVAVFVAAVAFLFYVRIRQVSISEGFQELKSYVASFGETLKHFFSKALPMSKIGLKWLLAHKLLVSVFAALVLVPAGAYAFQQSLLSNSKPDQFLAGFAQELDSGNVNVLDNRSYFADANSSTTLMPAEFLDAFEKTTISKSIQINRADSLGQVSFRINNRGPYKIESYDVFEFPLFVRKWKIVGLYSTQISWSLSGSDPKQVLTLGDKEISVDELSNSGRGLKQFRISPFGSLRYSLSALGFNKGIDNRSVSLVSGTVRLTLDAKSELPKDVVASAVEKAKGAITACMNRQAAGKADCDLMTWNPEDSRNASDQPFGDFKDEKIVGITWKLKKCSANFFQADTVLTGTQTVSCEGFREVKTKYVENNCYEKLVFGIYVYGCWGLSNSYGTSSEWFTASLDLPVVMNPESNKIFVTLPKN